MALRIRPAAKDDAQALTQVVNPIIAAGGTTAHQTPFDESRLLRHYIAPPMLVSCQVAEQDGIPMTINFHWNVENERRITGDLESTVTQQGMTCRMSRTYELDYDG